MSPERILPGSAGQPDPTPEGEPIPSGIDEARSADGDDGGEPVDRDLDVDGRSATNPTGLDEVEVRHDGSDDGRRAARRPTHRHASGRARGRVRASTTARRASTSSAASGSGSSISTVVILAGVISLAHPGAELRHRVRRRHVVDRAVEDAHGHPGADQPRHRRSGPDDDRPRDRTAYQRTVEVEAKLPKGQSAATQQAIANKVADELAQGRAQIAPNNVSVESVGLLGRPDHAEGDRSRSSSSSSSSRSTSRSSSSGGWRSRRSSRSLHDILVTVGIYSLSGFLVTPDTVVAFLTILGYSLYDTIVVFDRIRDNVKTPLRARPH